MDEFTLIEKYFKKLTYNNPSALKLNDDVFFDKKNNVVISSGSVTVTADANTEPSGIDLTLATGTAQAITWSEIIPGVNMTWVEIDPGV